MSSSFQTFIGSEPVFSDEGGVRHQARSSPLRNTDSSASSGYRLPGETGAGLDFPGTISIVSVTWAEAGGRQVFASQA